MLFSCCDRVIKEGLYICDNKATIRKTAQHFNVSKSCVHKDIHTKLKYADYTLYILVKQVLDLNFREKHIRGGNATRLKFKGPESLINKEKTPR